MEEGEVWWNSGSPDGVGAEVRDDIVVLIKVEVNGPAGVGVMGGLKVGDRAGWDPQGPQDGSEDPPKDPTLGPLDCLLGGPVLLEDCTTATPGGGARVWGIGLRPPAIQDATIIVIGVHLQTTHSEIRYCTRHLVVVCMARYTATTNDNMS